MTEEQKAYFRERARAWRREHPKAARKHLQKYYAEHREKMLAYQKAYRLAHMTLCDRKISELRALERDLRAFSNGGDATEDVIEYLDHNEYFCESDCAYASEIGGEITDADCVACARKRLNEVVER